MPFDVTTVPDDGDDEYILEVELEYPSNHHNLHSDSPLAPERTFVTDDMISLQTQLDLS